jgi:hypothetical protein
VALQRLARGDRPAPHGRPPVEVPRRELDLAEDDVDHAIEELDAPYPVQYSVDYPDRPLNRLSTFFRVFIVIPIAIVLALIEGGGYAYGGGRAAGAVGAAGLVVLPTLLSALPAW